jgi:hypothetical protein
MSWLMKRKVEQGTEQWKSLYDCFHNFAKDFQEYLALIDGEKWDVPKIQSQIYAVDANLLRAAQIWPEGKPVLKKIRRWFSKTVLIRNEEHRLNEYARAHPIQWDFKHLEEQLMKPDPWKQEMRKVGYKLDSAVNGIFVCFDEVKKKTSIDVNLWLKDKNFKILQF